MTSMELIPVEGMPEIAPGDDVATAVMDHTELCDGDVLVVTQKIVSKAEDRIVEVDPNDPLSHKPLVAREAVRVLRRRGDLMITETSHGFVCANSGIDRSNVVAGTVALLPEDSDRSARRIRARVKARLGVELAVIISDTFGRPWRRGVTDVAIGSAGLRPVVDLRGTEDAMGNELHVTEVAVADELAAAAELVMGKATGCPAAIVRGVDPTWFGDGDVASDLIRRPAEDLFR